MGCVAISVKLGPVRRLPDRTAATYGSNQKKKSVLESNERKTDADFDAADIVRRIHAGDTSAESEFFNRYTKSLMYVLQQRVRNRQQAEDIHQEAFRVVLERLRSKSLEDPQGLSAYLHRTAINLHIGEIRKSARRQTYADSELIDRQADDAADQVGSLMRQQANSAIRELIGKLKTPRDREMLRRFYLLDQEKSVVCQALGLTSRHFDRVIARARKRFRELVESQAGRGA